MKSSSKSVLCLLVPAFLLMLASANAAPSTAMLVWNGDDTGLKASGWASPAVTNKTGKSALTNKATVGVDGTAGLEWTVSGSDWAGFGWNWFGWYPNNAGTDFAKMQRLVFKV